jgi:hypothetical protein
MLPSIRLGFSTLVLLGALLDGGTAAEGQPRAAQPRIEDRMQRLRDEAPTLLESADPREQAWGAWLAGAHRMRELQPQLEVAVARGLAGAEHDSASLDFPLDALIQIDAALPADLLGQIAERRPVEALILLSHADESADPVLLSLLDREQGVRWLAIANLLLVRTPAGFAAGLLRGIRLDATVTVSDEGNALSGSGAGGGIGCGMLVMAPGMPPWPSYTLERHAGPGAVVLATGPTPIYYERRVSSAGRGPSTSDHFYDGPSGGDRLDYIAALVGLGSSLPLSGDEHRSIKWRGEAALADEIAAFRQDIDSRYALLLEMLVSGALLTRDEAAALPLDVTINVNDLRDNR